MDKLIFRENINSLVTFMKICFSEHLSVVRTYTVFVEISVSHIQSVLRLGLSETLPELIQIR